MRIRCAAGAALALLAAGCTDDGRHVRSVGNTDTRSASGSGPGGCGGTASGDAAVSVRVDQYAVTAAPTTVASGRIAFAVRNAGDRSHQLMVVRAESAAALPVLRSTDPLRDGSVLVAQVQPADFAGAIDRVDAGEVCSATFPLQRGRYVLFCNVDDHFRRGMHAPLTVT